MIYRQTAANFNITALICRYLLMFQLLRVKQSDLQ